MEFKVRQENLEDNEAVKLLIANGSHLELNNLNYKHDLVERLKKSPEFIPELSLVAEKEDTIIGQLLLTVILIQNPKNTFKVLGITSLCVQNDQDLEVISALIEKSHRIARKLEFKAVVAFGSKEIYSPFGYRKAKMFGLNFPIEFQEENCLVKELKRGSLFYMHGNVHYPKEFFSEETKEDQNL